jgi:D-3-phosphoglycerate dehydrogenase
LHHLREVEDAPELGDHEVVVHLEDIDVFDVEPLPAGHPLTKLDNVVLTSHCAGITPEALEAGLALAIENVVDFLNGNPTNVVTL